LISQLPFHSSQEKNNLVVLKIKYVAKLARNNNTLSFSAMAGVEQTKRVPNELVILADEQNIFAALTLFPHPSLFRSEAIKVFSMFN